tara:strand:+ start:111 stop:647 length:537 start_codon:yes stop_codon:yes gene_type:complete
MEILASFRNLRNFGCLCCKKVGYTFIRKDIPLDEIEVGSQPIFDDKVDVLRESIRREGLYNPIMVNSAYKLMDGHHRFLACKELGLHSILCYVVVVSDFMRLKRIMEEIEMPLFKVEWTETIKCFGYIETDDLIDIKNWVEDNVNPKELQWQIHREVSKSRQIDLVEEAVLTSVSVLE